jgi:two-component system sensor histidine kinase BaeS
MKALQSAPLHRTYLEVLVLGGLLYLLSSWMYGAQAPQLYTLSLLFFINPLCALLYALRLRTSQAVTEIIGWVGAAVLCSLVQWLTIYHPRLADSGIPLTAFDVTVLYLPMIFPYAFFRGMLRIGQWWLGWQSRHLIGSLMSSHLGAMALLQVIFCVPLLVTAAAQVNMQWAIDFMPQNAIGQLFYRVNVVLPMVGVVILAATLILAALLPASAVVSYFLARRIKQRLDTLMHAAQSARIGDYQTRIVLSGKDEIGQLQENFNAMIGGLSQTVGALQAEREKVTNLLRLRHELVANVSHELRTPLATLRATLESVQQRPSPALSAQEMALMQREVSLLQTLINDLFAVSRAETAQLHLNIGPLALPSFVAHILSTTAPLAWQNQRVQINAQIPPWIPDVAADPQRLEQALRNLIHNSLRHTLPGGLILVTAQRQNDHINLMVSDSGVGIPSEDLPHIWERYYRGERGENGLGLALVKSFIEAMGGHVSVESTSGQGTTFTLSLPLAHPASTPDLPHPQPIPR